MGFKARGKPEPITWVALISIEQPPHDLGATECVRALKAAGLQAKRGHSPYVGHATVYVPSGTRRHAAKVLGTLVTWVRDLYKYGGFKEEV